MSKREFDRSLRRRQAGHDPAGISSHPRGLTLDAWRERLARADRLKTGAACDHPHRVAGGKPLLRFQVAEAQRLP